MIPLFTKFPSTSARARAKIMRINGLYIASAQMAPKDRSSRVRPFSREFCLLRGFVVHGCIMFEINHFGHCMARCLHRRERLNPPFPTIVLRGVTYKYFEL